MSHFRRRFLSISGGARNGLPSPRVARSRWPAVEAFASHLPGSRLLRNDVIVGVISFAAVMVLFALIFKLAASSQGRLGRCVDRCSGHCRAYFPQADGS